MINRIDHIAIAVSNLETALSTFINVLGCDRDSVVIEEVPSQKVRVAFVPIGETRIELLESTGDESAVAKFLAKNGEGLHHIALSSDDLESETARVMAHGLNPLGQPSAGAGGTKVVFLHPRQTSRVLIELVDANAHQH